MRLPPGYEPALFLFTPRGEKLWADGWDPLFPAPADDDTEPGTVFETRHGQQRTTWVVCAGTPAGLSATPASPTAGMPAP